MPYIDRTYEDFDLLYFLDFWSSEYDNLLVTYKGKDYMCNCRKNKKTGKFGFYLCDAIEALTTKKPTALSAWYDTLDEFVNAPLFEGKTPSEVFDELLITSNFELIQAKA